MSEITFCTASELANKIQDKKVTSSEVLDAHLDHISSHNSQLNAIVTLNEENARQRAKEADTALSRGENWGPLHGVPVTIKDAFETRGLKTTSSFKPLANYIPQQDATVVERIQAAGAVIIGKTNMPTLALDIQSNSPLFGTANNPWDTTRTTGGSTGGGAASVAAGFSPLEIGSDIGGSVRIPAHFCGIFSIKPTENIVPMAGHIPEPPDAPRGVRHMGVSGPLARSVEDLQLVLPLLTGPDGKCWDIAPVSMEKVAESSLPKVRVAWTDSFGSLTASNDTRNCMSAAVDKLTEAGCIVEKNEPTDLDFEKVWQTWGELLGAEVGSGMPYIARLLTGIQYKLMRDQSVFKKGLLKGLKMSLHDYAKVLTRRDGLISILENFLAGWDAWLCPVTTGPAFQHCKTGQPIMVDDRPMSYFKANMGFTTVFNLTGNPVTVIPMGKSKEGLPIGMQIVGRRWNDMQVLSIAQAVSKAIKPFSRPEGY